MSHEYKTLHANTPELLDMLVNTFLEQHWDLWGNPFALFYPSSNVGGFIPERCIYHQVVVKLDPAGHSDVGKVKTAMGQVSVGYTVQVPETSAEVETIVSKSALSEFRFMASKGSFCTCLEKEGDSLDCPVHYGQPVPGLVS